MAKFPHKKHCLLVAEISANHCQDLQRAIEMIKKAKTCGADIVKFQTYTPDTLTLNIKNKYFEVRHPEWRGQTLYQLYEKACTPWNWFRKLKEVADDSGLIFLSTAFDKTAVDFLEDLGVSIHKIASFELVDLPLIEYMAKTKKPIILSTGMATLREIKEAVETARGAGAKEIVLLKCVSSYPASADEMNLRTIPHMKTSFGLPVGISDHTLGIGVSVAAVSLGAMMVEKHFTLSRKVKSPDSFFSLEPEEFKQLSSNIRMVEKALGKIHYGPTKGEEEGKVFRRSLFAVKDIRKGEILSEENVRSIRPSFGLRPKYLKNVLGRRSRKSIRKGTPLSWDMVEGAVSE
jgi:pseudaminic acid synthase